jgi:hypothetical protein
MGTGARKAQRQSETTSLVKAVQYLMQIPMLLSSCEDFSPGPANAYVDPFRVKGTRNG